MEGPDQKIRWPWWVWLIIILFPIPFGLRPWWVTVIFLALFAILVGAIAMHYKKNSSEPPK